jgi:hypothetical protein
MEKRINAKTDSFTIGSSTTGGQLKVYFDIDTETYEQIASKCDKIIKLWKATCVISGKAK